MVMGRGRALLRICDGCRKPVGRDILPPIPFVSLLVCSCGTFIWDTGAKANVEFGFEFVANVEFIVDSYSDLLRLPLELPDERLCGLGAKLY